MKTCRIIASFLACLILGTWAMAGPPQGNPQARARARANISTLKLLRMTEVLELTEDQTAKLFPALTRIEKEKAELQRRMGTEILELRAALGKDQVRDTDVLARVKTIRDIRASIKQQDDEFDAVLDANLTPVQKGKYLIFLVDFARGLGEKLNQARQIRGKISQNP
jgi:Spy/CpxP family protein refolding chaperone